MSFSLEKLRVKEMWGDAPKQVRPFPCTKVFTVQHQVFTGTGAVIPTEDGLIPLEVWQHSNAISSCGFASRESNHLCTFLESLGDIPAVAETPSSSPSTCHLVRRGSSGAKSQGSCLGYLWHGARECWAGDTGEYLLKSHKTFLVNQNSGNYCACWPGLEIYHDLGHPFK